MGRPCSGPSTDAEPSRGGSECVHGCSTAAHTGHHTAAGPAHPVRNPDIGRSDSSSLLTSSTAASGGPRHNQAASRSSASSAPHTTTSTRPSGRFNAWPPRPRRSACSRVEARNHTPWTRPRTMNLRHAIGSGPVHLHAEVAPAAIFSANRALQARCIRRTRASSKAVGAENGPGPSGCAPNRVMPRCSSFVWPH